MDSFYIIIVIFLKNRDILSNLLYMQIYMFWYSSPCWTIYFLCLSLLFFNHYFHWKLWCTHWSCIMAYPRYNDIRAHCGTTGNETRIYFSFLNWLFGVHSLRDTLLILDTEEQDLVLPQSNKLDFGDFMLLSSTLY